MANCGTSIKVKLIIVYYLFIVQINRTSPCGPPNEKNLACGPRHIKGCPPLLYPLISPPPPPHFYRPIPNHPHSSVPHAQTTSIYPTSPPHPLPVHPERRLYKSTLRFLSFSNTPHIHLIIIHSVLSKLCRFAFFIAQVSVPYVNALWTQALYIFSFYVV